jgi:hypothetical protein
MKTYQVIVIDIDTIFTEAFFSICQNVKERSECFAKLKGSDKFPVSEYFKNYDFFVRFLNYLHFLSQPPNNNQPLVFLTSTKLPRSILKQFLIANKNLNSEILVKLLRGADNDRIKTVGECTTVDCKEDEKYTFLNKYFPTSEYLQTYTQSPKKHYLADVYEYISGQISATCFELLEIPDVHPPHNLNALMITKNHSIHVSTYTLPYNSNGKNFQLQTEICKMDDLSLLIPN